jgi:amphi-Trp domain-containing protein
MTELDAVQESTRSEVAQYLREFADQLETTDRPMGTPLPEGGDTTEASSNGERRVGPDGKVTLVVGNDSATINPPETVGFTVRVDDDDPLVGGESERRLEFTLEWAAEAVEADGSLEIE